MQILLTTIGLGVAGIDPFAAVALLAAIMAGASRRKVLVFFASMFVFTVAIGVILSIAGDSVIYAITDILPSDNNPAWMYVNLMIIAALGGWLAYRWHRHVRPRPQRNNRTKRKLGGSIWSFAIAGIIYSFIGAFSDVTFYATVAVAAQAGNIFAIIGLHILWFVLGQFMLIALVVAYLMGAHKKLVHQSDLFWQKHKHRMPLLLYSAAGLAIVILLVDIVLFLVNGKYLF